MRLLACVVVWLLIAIGPVCGQDKKNDTRKPVPTAKEQAEPEKLIRSLFKADFAKTKATDRAALATKLLDQAAQSKDQPANRYVLLREARDLAAKGGDAAIYLKAAEEMAAEFRVEPGEAKAAAVDVLLVNLPASQARDAAQGLFEAGEAAVNGGEFDAAQKLFKGAESAARKAGVSALVSAIAGRNKALTALRKDFEKLPEARKKLDQSPTDPQANLLVGKYLCLLKGDWDSGLPHLILGGDKTLKNAALKDADAKSGAGPKQLEAADAWYNLAAEVDAGLKPAVQQRALYWYQEAAKSSTGLGKLRAEKRADELAKVLNPAARPDPVATAASKWALIRTALKDKSTRQSALSGMTDEIPFNDLPSTGGILIGFHFTNRAGKSSIDSFQPIYLTDKGEKTGNTFGTIRVGSKIQTIKAKPGYAVGELKVSGGFHGFQPTFMKITDKGLSKADSYESTYVGSDFGESATFSADGNFMVGCYGYISTGGYLYGFGVITTNFTAKKSP
jgi:hypothetical protein